MNAILLAGGTGSRMKPTSMVVNKHLLPVYNKPMIFYSLSVLLLCKFKEIIKKILSIVNKRFKFKAKSNLIKYVKDRAGHDKVYRINSSKIRNLGWKNRTKLNDGLFKTIKFYIN